MGVVKTLLLVAGIVYVGVRFVAAIGDIRHHQLDLRVHALWLVASGALVFLAFLVLIEAWAYVLAALAGRRLPFADAARIWFISNLSIYIPAGPGWQILQMGVMSTEQGIGAISASAAAVINAAINIACGMAVAVIAGAPLLASFLGAFAWIGMAAALLAAVGVAAMPVLLRIVLRIARERFHRAVPLEPPPARVIMVATAANIIAWVIYGLALECLSRGIIGTSPGTLWQYTASFAAAYVMGYLVFLVPGGIGVRELTLARVMAAAGLTTGPQASLIVVASRLTLIVVQVIPALLFLAYRRRTPDETDKIVS